MYGVPNTFCTIQTATATSDPNQFTTILLDASANNDEYIVIWGITAGYSGDGSGGIAVVWKTSTTMAKVYLDGASPLRLRFPSGLYYAMGQYLTITIYAGGAGLVGRLSVEYSLMHGTPDSRWVSTPQCHVPAVNTEATLTLAAATGVTHVLTDLIASYDGDPAAAKELTVVTGSTTRFSTAISAAGSYPFTFDKGLYGAAGEAMTISLPASGDAGVKGSISIITH